MTIHALLLLGLQAVVSLAAAQGPAGRYLYFRPSAVSSALGGSGVATAGDGFAAYFNPALLASQPEIVAAGSVSKPVPFLPNVIHSFFSAAVNLGGSGALGASTNVYWSGTHPRTENDPTILSTEKSMSWQGKISYGLEVVPNFAVGVSVNLLSLHYSSVGTAKEQGKGTAATASADIGCLLIRKGASSPAASAPDRFGGLESLGDRHDPPELAVGISLLNMGPKIVFVDQAQGDPQPATLLVGLSVAAQPSARILIRGVLEYERRWSEVQLADYVHAGGEIRLLRLLVLRGGFVAEGLEIGSLQPAYGAGITLSFLHINVSRTVRAFLPGWQFDGSFHLEL